MVSNNKSNNGSSSNNREPRHTVDEVLVACILISFAANPLIFQERSSVATNDRITAVGDSSVTPPPTAEAHSDGLYYCELCGRSFTSFQALGGHIAAHNRQPTEMSRVPFEEGCSSIQPPPKRQRAERIHQCWTCGRVFPTGQSLGGHMRAHYRGDLSRGRHAANANNVASSPSAVNLPRDDHQSVAAVDANNDNVVSSEAGGNNNVVAEVVKVENEPTSNVQIATEPIRASGRRPLDIDLNVKLEEEPAEEPGQATGKN